LKVAARSFCATPVPVSYTNSINNWACSAVLISAYFFSKQQGYKNAYTVAEQQFLKEKDQTVAAAIKELNRKRKVLTWYGKKFDIVIGGMQGKA